MTWPGPFYTGTSRLIKLLLNQAGFPFTFRISRVYHFLWFLSHSGLAELGVMCRLSVGAFNVNNDLGLQTAGIIAHETGHK